MSIDPMMLEVLATVPQAPDWVSAGDIQSLRRAAAARSEVWGAGPYVAEVFDENAVHREAEDVPVRVYRPSRDSLLPGIVFLHGGGWSSGSVDSYDSFCRRLAVRVGAVVVSVDYRLAPEHPFPAPYDDAVTAIEWTSRNAERLGIDSETIALAGDSAGATLALAAVPHCRSTGIRLAAMMLWYPSTMEDPEPASMQEHAADGTLSTEATRLFVSYYAGPLARPFPPEFAPSAIADLTGFPPAVIALAEYDPIRDEGRNLAERLTDAGVPTVSRVYPTLPHGYAMYTTHVPVAAAAVEESLGSFAALLRRSSAGRDDRRRDS